MTAVAAPAAPASPALPVARQLALVEGRRIVTDPLMLVGVALFSAVVVVSSGQGAGSGYDGVLTGQTFFLGVFAYFAASRAATRPRRDASLDEHVSLPASALARTAGLCLAAAAPAMLAVALSAAALAWFASGRVDLPVWPSPGEIAAGPLTVLGGALLGTMVARWLPFPTAPLLVMGAVVATTFVLNEGWEGRYALLSPYAPFGTYVPDGSWGGHQPGSPGWHAVYLAALCGMAAAGALLRDARRPALPVLAGAALTALAVLSGTAQLP